MPDEKEIFPYQRQGKKAWGDPLALQRRLELLLGDVNDVLNQTRSPDAQTAFPAVEILRRAVCRTFDLGEPFDPETGEGVMEAEWTGVLADFTEWLEKNASRAAPSVTESPPTAVPVYGGPSPT